MNSRNITGKAEKKTRRPWITIWLIVATIVLMSVMGRAAYTGVTKVKRVVSTKAGAGLLFSSNYLTTGGLISVEQGNYDEYLDVITGNPIDADPTFILSICNYPQGDKSTWYTSGNIQYSITAELLLSEKYTVEEATALGNASLAGQYKSPSSTDLGTKKFGIKYSEDASYSFFSSSNLTITLPETGSYSLSKSTTSMQEFSVILDKSELKKALPAFYIRITATPTATIAGEVEPLVGYIGICQSSGGEATWSGSIEDDDYDSSDYDAYNYVISGYGSGTFYFAWDDTKVKPNEFALYNYGVSSGSVSEVTDWSGYKQYGSSGPSSETGIDTWKYLTLTVDSDTVARYVFQMFKTSGANYSSVISKYVDYKFVAD